MQIFTTLLLLCMSIQTVHAAKSPLTSVETFLSKKLKTTPRRAYQDAVTNAHELAHSLNAQLRREKCNAGENCLYLPDQSIYVLAEPDILKSEIVDYIPNSERGRHFDYYVVQSADWEEYPSYLIDEWIAFYRGAQAGLENYQYLRHKRDALTGLVELATYSNAILDAMRSETPEFYKSGKGMIYKKIIDSMNTQTAQLVQQVLAKSKLYFETDRDYALRYLNRTKKRASTAEARNLSKKI